jgi:hypothetical protein
VRLRERKRFFFEKKKQKTFVHLGPVCRRLRVSTGPKVIKVFWFFFSKKNALAFFPPHDKEAKWQI